MKFRVAKGEALSQPESAEWVSLVDQMIQAVLMNSANVHKYFSYGTSRTDRKPSACFSLNVAMDDFALCIEAESIWKKANMRPTDVRSFLKKWKNIPQLDRVTRDPAETEILMERRSRFEQKLKLCKLEVYAPAREKCIVRLENMYLDEKYGKEPKKLAVKKARTNLRKRKYISRMLAGAWDFGTSERTEEVEYTSYINLFDVPCPDDEYGSLCTQFCCQEGSEHDLFCNLLVECY